MPLSVLTLNLWHNAGPYAARRTLIRAWIERLQPDLIGFQEALGGDELDQVSDLLDGFGYQTEHATAVRFWADTRFDFGNALASRWPIRDREVLDLPNAGDDEQRIALSATVEAPFGPVGITTTHLNWKLHHGAVRERQVVAVCAFARRRRPRDGFPPILVGDFNAEPDSTEIRYIMGLHALAGQSVHFRDAWSYGGEGDRSTRKLRGVTWSNDNAYAGKALEPDRRLDYIFVGPPQADGVGVIEHCRVVCNEERDGVWPSDHFGVYAEFRTEPLPR